MSRPIRQYERLRPGKSEHRRSVDPNEESLRQTEQRFRAIFDNTSDGIFLHDLETRQLVMGNKSCLQMLGYTEEEFLQLGVADIHAAADLPFIYAQIEEFLQGGKPIRHDIRFRRKDGSILFADVSPDLVLLDGKRYVMVAMKDITERKRMEEELRRHAEHLEELVEERTSKLRENEMKYRSLYHTIADGVFVIGADGRIDDVNDSACAQLGYARDELIGMPVSDISARADFDLGQIFDGLRTAGSLSYETAHRRKDGTVIPVELSIALIEYHGRSAVLEVARDITKRKRTEEALRFIQFAVDHTADGAFWMTEDARFCYVNEAACKALGYSRDELLGMTVYDIDPAFTKSMWDESWRHLKAKKSVILETLHRTKDGRVYPVEIRANYLEFGGQEFDCAFARDISERRQAEEALRESEERFRTAFEAGAVAMALTAMDTTMLKVNPSFCRMLGYSESELVGKSYTEITHPDDIAANLVASRQLAGGEISVFRMEKRYIRKDGAVVWADMNTASVPGADGRPLYCVTHIQDITERKLAEEALRQSEARHRRLIENLKGSHFVYVHDTEGVFRYLSESITDVLGYKPDEFMDHYGKYLTDHPVNQAVCRHTDLTIQGIRQPPYEVNIWHKDGSTRWLEVQEVPVFDENGKVVAVEGVAQDITERKHAEEALRESEERHRFLVESVNDWIWETDRNGVYTYASPQCREMLGYEPQEIVGKTPFDLMPPDEAGRLREIFLGIASQAKPFRRIENVNRRKDGRLVVLETNGVPVLDAQGKLAGYRGVDRDITERRQAEEALREKEYLLSESQRIGHIGTWSADPATGFGTWTQETYRLFGVSPETFVPTAEGVLRLLHPDDRGAMQEWVRAALAGEHPDVLEFRVVLPDGSVRVLSGHGEMIFDDENRPIRLVGTVQDVTEQKQAQETLRNLGRKNAEALRVARMGHWEFDVAAGMFIFNDQYYTLHGITAREAGGYRMTTEQFARRYVHPDDAHLVAEAICRALASEDPDFQFQTEARILRTDGETRYVTVWFRVEKDAQGKTIKLHGVNQDITERRYAEEALRRLNENLEQQVAQRTEALTHSVARLQQLTWELSQAEDRERRRIADLLHDDVQQILAAARFHLNLLSIETRSSAESREIICQVRKMLKDAIEKARSLSHELSPALYQVELTEILGWLGDHMHRKHGLVVHVKAHGQIDPCSESLKALLYKVAQELLFNVVKHAGVKEATVRVRRMGRCIYLSVTDQGLGFEPRGLEETAGFGLLSIRERVHLLGGRMKIKSAPGTGSRFLVVIPDEGSSPAAEIDRGQI